MRSHHSPHWKVKLCVIIGESLSETRQTSPTKVYYAYLRKRPRAAGALFSNLPYS